MTITPRKTEVATEQDLVDTVERMLSGPRADTRYVVYGWGGRKADVFDRRLGETAIARHVATIEVKP
jgi:hypothetical protein